MFLRANSPQGADFSDAFQSGHDQGVADDNHGDGKNDDDGGYQNHAHGQHHLPKNASRRLPGDSF